MKVRWLGQGGYELKDETASIMIDPYYSDLVEVEEGMKRMVPPPEPIDQLKTDLILITHNHIDHLDSMLIKEMNKEGVLFAGPDSCTEMLPDCGVPEKQILTLNRQDTMQYGNFHIRAVFAEHTEDSIGFVIQHRNKVYYFTGDSLFTPEVGRGIEADVIFTCINGRLGNMKVEEAVELTKRVDAKLGIPNHYGMFVDNTEDPQKYVDGLQGSGIETKVLEWNKEYEI